MDRLVGALGERRVAAYQERRIEGSPGVSTLGGSPVKRQQLGRRALALLLHHERDQGRGVRLAPLVRVAEELHRAVGILVDPDAVAVEQAKVEHAPDILAGNRLLEEGKSPRRIRLGVRSVAVLVAKLFMA